MKNLLIFCGLVVNFALITICFGQQIENPGFEEWEEVGFGPDTLEPVNWSSIKTSNDSIVNLASPVVWAQSTDSHNGLYSLKLINVEIFTLIAPGTTTNGRVYATLNPEDARIYTDTADSQWNTPLTDTPDSIAVWLKYVPVENDTGQVIAVLHAGEATIVDSTMTNWIAVAQIDYSGDISDWTRLTAPFEYLNSETPEYILIGLYSAIGLNGVEGSIAYFDDLELIYNTTGFKDEEAVDFDIYSYDNNVVINWTSDKNNKTSICELYDLTGKKIWEEKLFPNRKNTLKPNVTNGIYVCRIIDGSTVYSRKLLIR